MNANIEETCTALDNLATAVKNLSGETRPLTESNGWNAPALTITDLANWPTRLADRFRKHGSEDAVAALLKDAARKLELLQTQTVPQMMNGGNSPLACAAYVSTLYFLDGLLPEPDWEALQDNKAMPVALVRRLRGIKAEIDRLAPDQQDLARRISVIQEATEAAESLPADLQALVEARTALEKISREAAAIKGVLDKQAAEIGLSAQRIKSDEVEVQKLVAQCEDAYRITTTKGLAAAFDQRAARLGVCAAESHATS